MAYGTAMTDPRKDAYGIAMPVDVYGGENDGQGAPPPQQAADMQAPAQGQDQNAQQDAAYQALMSQAGRAQQGGDAGHHTINFGDILKLLG